MPHLNPLIEFSRIKKASIALAGFSLFATKTIQARVKLQALHDGAEVDQVVFTIDTP